jgi:hypothetical protein
MAKKDLTKQALDANLHNGETEFPTLSRRNTELPTGGIEGWLGQKLLEARTNLLRKRGWVDQVLVL